MDHNVIQDRTSGIQAKNPKLRNRETADKG